MENKLPDFFTWSRHRQQLHDELYWTEQYFTRYANYSRMNGSEMKVWQYPSFWYQPLFNIDLAITKQHDQEYSGVYKIPVQVRNNNNFLQYLKEGQYITHISKYESKFTSKQTAQDHLIQISNKMIPLQHQYNQYIMRLAGSLIELATILIRGNYLSHPDHENTFMQTAMISNDGISYDEIEVISNFEIAFRGIQAGSSFAFWHMLDGFIPDHEVLPLLWELRDKLQNLSKQYLALQLFITHFKSKAGSKEKVSQENIIHDVQYCVNIEQDVLPGKGIYKFLTPENKIKHSTIGDFINLKREFDLSYKGMANKVLQVLPDIDSVIKRGKHFYKKRK